MEAVFDVPDGVPAGVAAGLTLVWTRWPGPTSDLICSLRASIANVEGVFQSLELDGANWS
jgi:hypothetical protein